MQKPPPHRRVIVMNPQRPVMERLFGRKGNRRITRPEDKKLYKYKETWKKILQHVWGNITDKNPKKIVLKVHTDDDKQDFEVLMEGLESVYHDLSSPNGKFLMSHGLGIVGLLMVLGIISSVDLSSVNKEIVIGDARDSASQVMVAEDTSPEDKDYEFTEGDHLIAQQGRMVVERILDDMRLNAPIDKPDSYDTPEPDIKEIPDITSGEDTHDHDFQPVVMQGEVLEDLQGVPFPDAPKTFWDNKSEYFKPYSNGKFPQAEFDKNRTVLAKGVEIYKDMDLIFYKVQPGDSIFTIKAKLRKHKDRPEFKHLRWKRSRLTGFNIPAKNVEKGTWIPLPTPSKHRILTDEQFLNYAYEAIEDMEQDSTYGKYISRMMETVPKRDLMSLMLAVAKQESGGKPLGQFEWHAFEKHHHVFSYSLFHVLMKGVGLEVRRDLNMTQGQTYHPRNAARLFLAFIIHKTGNDKPEDLFPMSTDHMEDFASLYNGNWQKYNPEYPINVMKYFEEAQNLMYNVPEPEEEEEDVVNASNPIQKLPKVKI